MLAHACLAAAEVRTRVQLKALVGEWRHVMPCLLELGNKAMRPQHWRQVFAELVSARAVPGRRVGA